MSLCSLCVMSGPGGDWVVCWPQVRQWHSLSGPGPASRHSDWSRLITWPGHRHLIGSGLLRMARLLRALSSRCHSSALLSLLGAHHNTPHHSINSSTTLLYLHFNCHQSSGLSSARLTASRNTLHQTQDPAWKLVFKVINAINLKWNFEARAVLISLENEWCW